MNLAIFVTLMILSGISIPFWLRGIRRVQQDNELIDRRLRIPTSIGFVDVIIMFFSWSCCQVIAVACLGAFINNLDEILKAESFSDEKLLVILVLGFSQIAGTALAMAVTMIRHGGGFRVFGFQPEYFRRDLSIGLLAFAMVIPALLILQFLLGQLVEYKHDTIETLRSSFGGKTMFVTWMTSVVFAPIAEEIFFRGILQSWLSRLRKGMTPQQSLKVLMGGFAVDLVGDEQKPIKPSKSRFVFITADSSAKWMPIIVSAAAFGMVHIGQGAAPVALFVFGLALGYLYRQTGSITICIVLHMLLNAFSMFWITLELCLT